jgi:hypothetical protein
MPALNRFPLLGLWAREAARRIGYSTPDAEAIGHAYALLYAIRANTRSVPAKAAENKARPRRSRGVDALTFGGDTLHVAYDDAGHVQGVVGGARPQTPRWYRTSIANKFPPRYLAAVSTAFQGAEPRGRRQVGRIEPAPPVAVHPARSADADRPGAWHRKTSAPTGRTISTAPRLGRPSGDSGAVGRCEG